MCQRVAGAVVMVQGGRIYFECYLVRCLESYPSVDRARLRSLVEGLAEANDG